MTNFSYPDDYDLCRVAAGNGKEAKDAEQALIEKYSVLVRICARPYFLAGGDSEDLIQEGFLGLLSAVRQFDSSKNTSFKTFAELCIRNRLYTAVKSASRLKHTPLNDSISLESPHFDNGQAGATFLRDPESLVIDKEQVDELFETMRSYLSTFEVNVLSLYSEGRSYSEIAEALNKPVKSIDNAVQRIRKKVSQRIII